MSSISSIKTWTSEVLYAADLNSWFTEIRSKVNTYGAWLDNNQTFTGNQTFSGTIAANGAVTTAAGITVNTTGITIAPQTAITFSHASARIVPGATGLYFRNNANSADNLAIVDAGDATFRAGLTIAGGLAGVTTLSMSSTLTMTASASRIVAGATSFAIRNNANSADNILVTDAGVVTVRSHLNVTGAIGGNGSSAVSISGTTVTLQNSSGLIQLGTAGGGAGSTSDIPKMPAVSGAPSGAVADGAFILDSTNHRLYVRSGSSWMYAALT